MVTKQLTLRPGSPSSKHRPNTPIPNSSQELRVQVRRLEVGGGSLVSRAQAPPISARQSVTLKIVVIVRSSPQKCLKHFRFRNFRIICTDFFSVWMCFFWCIFYGWVPWKAPPFWEIFFLLEAFSKLFEGSQKIQGFFPCAANHGRGKSGEVKSEGGNFLQISRFRDHSPPTSLGISPKSSDCFRQILQVCRNHRNICPELTKTKVTWAMIADQSWIKARKSLAPGDSKWPFGMVKTWRKGCWWPPTRYKGHFESLGVLVFHWNIIRYMEFFFNDFFS